VGKIPALYFIWSLPYAVLAVSNLYHPDFGVTGKIIYAGATYVLLMTAYAAINLP